jgi:sulfite exporter TauE/SafE
MPFKNLNIIIMLIAGIIVTVISMISKYALNHLVYTLMIVLIIFFILGTVIQMMLTKITEKADLTAREKEKQLLDKEVKSLEEGKEASKDIDDES